MDNKLSSKALDDFEATRESWQEALDGVREIKAGRGKQTMVEAMSNVVLA